MRGGHLYWLLIATTLIVLNPGPVSLCLTIPPTVIRAWQFLSQARIIVAVFQFGDQVTRRVHEKLICFFYSRPRPSKSCFLSIDRRVLPVPVSDRGNSLKTVTRTRSNGAHRRATTSSSDLESCRLD